MFTTINGIGKFIDAGLPSALGSRMQFAVIEGLKPVPTGWPSSIKIIRVSDPLIGTSIGLVQGKFLTYIGPERKHVELVKPHGDHSTAQLLH